MSCLMLCHVTGHLSTTTLKPETTTKLAPPATWMTSSFHRRPHHHDNDDDDVTSGKRSKHHSSEHERFVRAKTDMEKRHHERVTKVDEMISDGTRQSCLPGPDQSFSLSPVSSHFTHTINTTSSSSSLSPLSASIAPSLFHKAFPP